MTKIPDQFLWRLERSDGYMDLRMWDRARAELESIPEAYRDTLEYQRLTMRFALEQQNWPEAMTLGERLCRREPGSAGHWIQLAYAARRARGIEAARSILLRALQQFPEEPIIPFNLACYECQLGHREAAINYLSRAEKLEPLCRAMALEDDDLEPLWPELEW